MKSSLSKNFIIYFIGNFGSKVLGILLIPIYTESLNSVDFGFYDMVVTVSTILLPIVSFQLGDAILRYLLKAENDLQKKDIITNSSSIILSSMIVMNIFLIIFMLFFDYKYKVLIFLYININIIYNIVIQIARGLKENKLYAFCGFLYTLIFLSLNIFFIKVVFLGVAGLILSYIIASLICIIFVESKIKITGYYDRTFIKNKTKKELVKFSLPLIPNMISWWIMNMSNRVVINLFIGLSANGLYAIANKFPSFITMLASIFTLAWQEEAINNDAKENKSIIYSSTYNMYMIFLFSGANVLISLNHIIYKILVKSEYFESWVYVPILYYAAVFSALSSFFGAFYLSTKKTKGAFHTSVLGAVCNFLTNILLVKMIGLYAASISTLVAFIVMWVIRSYESKKLVGIKLNIKVFLTLNLITLITFVLYYTNNFILNMVSIILNILAFLFFNRNLVIKVLGKLKR